jgi:hypothetical protein
MKATALPSASMTGHAKHASVPAGSHTDELVEDADISTSSDDYARRFAGSGST